MGVNDNNYTLTLKLSNYIGAKIMPIENDEGFIEDCLVIPIDKNDLYVSKNKNVYSSLFMTNTYNGNLKGWTHYLRLKMCGDKYRKLLSLGYDVPYLGNGKPSWWNDNVKKTGNVKNNFDL